MTITKHATEAHSTSQKSTRGGRPIQYIIIHHAATLSASGVIGMMTSGSRQVSSHLVIKDARIAAVVEEESRAWSVSSAEWDGKSLTIETANETGAPSWTISEASYVSLAKVVADWSSRYGIPLNRDRVIGHREVFSRFGAGYATACPGGIDLDRVVAMASAIANPTNNSEDETMYYRVINKPSDDGLLKVGNLFKSVAGGPFFWCTNLEDIFVQAERQPVRQIDGRDLRLLVAAQGFAEFESRAEGVKISNGVQLEGPGRFTGKILYGPGSAAPVVLTDAQVSALAVQVAAKLPPAPTPPTVAEIVKGVISEIAS